MPFETERLRAEVLEAKLRGQAKEHAARQHAVAALQLRIQTLHASKLLTDDELYMYSLEDTIVDSIEVRGSGTSAAAEAGRQHQRMAVL